MFVWLAETLKTEFKTHLLVSVTPGISKKIKTVKNVQVDVLLAQELLIIVIAVLKIAQEPLIVNVIMDFTEILMNCVSLVYTLVKTVLI